MAHPNYKELEPDPEKDRRDYSWPERRAELYDRMERVGTWENLPKSLRDLGREYGVAHSTIRDDRDAILEWQREHLGENAVPELSLLESSAVKDHTDAARYHRAAATDTDDPLDRAKHLKKSAEHKERAYQLASQHLTNLQSTGDAPRAAEQLDMSLEAETEHSLSDEERELGVEAIRAIQAASSGGDQDDDQDELEEDSA